MKNKINTNDLLVRYSEQPLELLEALGGYYSCPKDKDGKRYGNMVGYAGKYPDGMEGEKQYVGDIYVNFARAEEYPVILEFFARKLEEKMDILGVPIRGIDVLCGAPMGGLCFNAIFGMTAEKRIVFPEKQIVGLKTADAREESELAFDRHEINKGEKVVIVEDVTNNFSTTNRMISLIVKAGGEVKAIVSFLNRSVTKENVHEVGERFEFISGTGQVIPVISLVRKVIPQYRQDEDEEIKEMIRKNRVVWKPKNEWSKLMSMA